MTAGLAPAPDAPLMCASIWFVTTQVFRLKAINQVAYCDGFFVAPTFMVGIGGG